MNNGTGTGNHRFQTQKSNNKKKKNVTPEIQFRLDLDNCSKTKDLSAADKGFCVEDHMLSIGLQLEESELAALFKVSVEKGREQKIYEYLHKLRNFVRGVDDSTAEIIQSWFGREEASGVGLDIWDEDQVKEAIVKNGGGWHGTGWLGRGEWLVQISNISSNGRCLSCSEQLVCVDTSREEIEKFSQSVASLAREREVEAHFTEFQD